MNSLWSSCIMNRSDAAMLDESGTAENKEELLFSHDKLSLANISSVTWWSGLSMDASKSLSCENNNSSLFSAVPDSSNMYQNKDSNLISDAAMFLK